MKILCLGDVVARPGRKIVQQLLPGLRDEHNCDLVIVNGENAAGGSGIDKKCYKELRDAGADVITLGDHTWRRPEVRDLLRREEERLICPANYPPSRVVRGSIVVSVEGVSVGVANLLGRTFLSGALDCPFAAAERILSDDFADAPVRIVDFHGEATSEKNAFGLHFDGRVSVVFGTHTHIQTADEQVLPNGTAYITDLGMCGSRAGVIGLDRDVAIQRFLTGMPSTYRAAEGNEQLSGIVIDVDATNGQALSIHRVLQSA
ncbi:MAG: TIGR00282 family metallophosphoesterase [Bdellovibrionales bacterium]|nr:TIGR00282 family metallophosphoesterase [Bdellovibrionales bacterium]